MLFNSYVFIFLFLPITLFVFFWLGRVAYHRVAITWLVASSLFFYGWWNPSYVPLIIFSMLFNYAFGIELSRHHGNSNKKTKLLLIFGISANLTILGYYKYVNFFLENINNFYEISFTLHEISLPLAISFFTFQQIAYLVDAYRGETKEYSFIHYCLFVVFFPQLIAGPIVHHKEILPQFSQSKIYHPQLNELAIGITIFFIGLFKKVVIADNMALHATPIFHDAESGLSLSFFKAWEGALAYTFQLYFDFSGYSDMAIGIARMFSIKLPVNFDSPYKSTSIIEFWRRWHITLSHFLRDYLYFSLGGNKKGIVRRYLNLMITMVLGGLWHGAGWTFIAWGTLHGLYLVTNHLWRSITKGQLNNWFFRKISHGLTMLCIVVGWVFFRSESFSGALTILSGMMNLPNAFDGHIGPIQELLAFIGFNFQGGYLSIEDYKMLLWGLFWLAIVWFWPNTQTLILANQNENSTNPSSIKFMYWQPTVLWAYITAIIAVLGVLRLSSISEFLYFQF